MRYLSSISLALVVHVLLSIVVLMALACTAEPATPKPEVLATKTPTPTKTPLWSEKQREAAVVEWLNRPTLSELDALVIVKNHLGLKPVNHTYCLDFLAQSGNLGDVKWEAIFVPSERRGITSTTQPDTSGNVFKESF